jgi:hypothetical protein
MTKILRILIITEIVFTILEITFDIVFEKSLPPKFLEYIASTETVEISTNEAVGLIISVVLIVVTIVSWIGLWRLWRPAKLLYTLKCLLGPIIYLILEPVVYYTPLGAFFSEYAVLSAGAILSIIYFTESM